jgi:hypothetical protein
MGPPSLPPQQPVASGSGTNGRGVAATVEDEDIEDEMERYRGWWELGADK